MFQFQGNTQVCPSVSCRPNGELKGDPLACQQLFMRPYWSEGLVIRKTETWKLSGELKGDPICLSAVWMCVASPKGELKGYPIGLTAVGNQALLVWGACHQKDRNLQAEWWAERWSNRHFSSLNVCCKTKGELKGYPTGLTAWKQKSTSERKKKVIHYLAWIIVR